MKQRLNLLIAVFVVAATAAGCRSLDVIGQTAVRSFEALLASPKLQLGSDPGGSYWVITAPGGEQFRFSRDFSVTHPDLSITLDAGPFLAAGMDPAQLPADRYSFDAQSGRLNRQSELGAAPLPGGAAQSALATFQQIVESYRSRIGYHAQFDHYGVDLGEGDMFEWAKDMATNDKDLVFVLAPAPFLEAGVDPARVAGWTFGKVKVKDKSGQESEVEKFLKPYNLQ